MNTSHLSEDTTDIFNRLAVSWVMQLASSLSGQRAGFNSSFSPCAFVEGKMLMKLIFPLPILFPCQYHSTNAPHSLIHHRHYITSVTHSIMK